MRESITGPPPKIHGARDILLCEGCGDCGRKSNCLSVQPVETEFGSKTRIHQSSCNKDYLCLDGDCPSFVTVRGDAPPPPRPRAVDPLEGDTLPPPAASTRLPWNIRIVGMGGTGVVTVAQILGTAAWFDGVAARGLDQTGLAQKGGPVVSDLRLFESPTETANKISAGDCDLYLGCDLLVAGDPRYVLAASRQRTRAVVSTARFATGTMVAAGGRGLPDLGDLQRRIDDAVNAGASIYVDAQHLAEVLIGSEQYSNILLVGVAYQRGLLPLAAEAIENAIRLNGASVDENIQAFRRGRQWVADRAAVENLLAAPSRRAPAPTGLDAQLDALVRECGASHGSELERIVRVRVPDLVAYHNRSYAERYIEFVARVRAAEEEHVGSALLAETVARNLYKLMAFKDEYEVARLHLDPSFRASIEARLGQRAKVEWHLHPPLLRALGLRRKIRLGCWFSVVYRLLYTARRLRFTPLDVFGYSEVRRIERILIGEYKAVVQRLLEGLTPKRHALSVEIASLPELVRGYEQIKLASVALYRERTLLLLQELEAPSGGGVSQPT